MTTPGKNKNDSKILGTKKRKAAATSAIAVLAIAILLVSSIPMPTQGIPTTDKVPEQGYKGDYYVVRYHLNYPYYASIIQNAMDDGHNDGYSFSGQKSEQITVDNVTYTDYYVDVPSYGSIVSTEYNPQFWKDTVVTNQEISWNWLDVNRYVEDETVVFTGWRYFSADSGDTHYPGEVMSNADLKKAIKVNKTISGVTYSVKVLEVFATWDTVKEVRLVTRDGVATPDSDGRQAYTFDAAARSFPSAAEGGSPYTSIMLIYAQKNGNTGTTAEKERGKVVLGGTTSTYAPMTIRSDPVSKDANDFVGRLVASSNSSKFLAGADTIIDDLAIWFGGAGGNHGSTETGLYGMGHAFVIGTGIYSLFESGNYNADMRRGFTQISGGVNNYSKITTEHDIGVYVEDGVDEDGEPVPHVRSTPIRTMLIVHSGTWHNIMASGRGNTNGESVYAVVKNAVVLDTMAGAGSNGGNNQTFDSIYLYLVNTKLPGDMYEMQNLNLDNSIPRLISRDTSFLPEWPYLIDSDHLAENSSLGIRSFGNANHTESTILSGGSNGKQENIQNTFIYIAGESQLWDAQSAGRTPEKTKVVNGTIELSGKATVAHILCGATTDGNQSNTAYESIKNTHIVVKDSAKAGTVCGAGFDTSYPAVSATMKNGGSIVVEIRGGTVC
ncbi:MAG: hypothetical protein IKR86_04045, partial [Candidatus Methanomethylophilaceae archaeon]|nr:hypothetical protein [Candidatus Methanomethylophilaceae archaeon]